MIIEDVDSGKTVAAIVRAMHPELPWSKARKWCASGRVLVDGQVQRDAAARVSTGMSVEIGSGRRDRSEDVIIAVDHDLVVVNKPAGLVSVPFEARGEARKPNFKEPPTEDDTLLRRVHVELRRRFGPVPPPRVVQRLDRETSGVLVLARNRRSERAVQEQLRTHDVDRQYVALAWGRVRPMKLDTWLVRDRGDRRRGSTTSPRGQPGAKRAITHVELRRYFPAHDVSLIECRLHTGRQHQIRIHLAESGHPLLGDRVYLGPFGIDRDAWSKDHEEPLAALGVARTMLHAEVLGILHPSTAEPVRYQVDPPPDFAAVLALLSGG